MKFILTEPEKPFAIPTKKFLKWNPIEHGITQSMLTAYRKCPSAFRARTKGLYKPGVSKALVFGSVFHEALDLAMNDYKRGEIEDPSEYTTQGYKQALNEFLHKQFAEDYKEADFNAKKWYREAYSLTCLMLPMYMTHWKEDFFGPTKKDFVQIEETFNVPFLDGQINLRGKRDAMFRKSDGGIWLMEHKTKSQVPEEALSMTIARDLQVMMYILSAGIEDPTSSFAKGVLYNVIRRPQLRLGKNEAWQTYLHRVETDIMKRPAFYFIRWEVPVHTDALRDFDVSLGNELVCLLEWYNKCSEKFDPQFTHECNSTYGKCPFIEYCDSNKEDLSFLLTKDKFHTEL